MPSAAPATAASSTARLPRVREGLTPPHCNAVAPRVESGQHPDPTLVLGDAMDALPGEIFVAGAGGVIGRRLLPLLRQRAREIEDLGAAPIVVDVFDREAIARAVAVVQPRVVIHQLTDLSGGFAREQIG